MGTSKNKESVYISMETLNVGEAAEAIKTIIGPLSDVSKTIAILITKQEQYAKKAASMNKELVESSKALVATNKTLALASGEAKKTQNDFASLNKGLSSFGLDINKTISQLTGIREEAVAMISRLGVWTAAAIKAGQAMFNMAMDYAKAWETQAKAENNLEQALASSGMSSHAEELKQYASELQKITTVGDEVSMGLMTQASAWAGNSENVKKATLAAINFEAAGGNAKEALKKMADATRGNIDSLKDLGIYLTANQKKNLMAMEEEERKSKIIELVNERYKEQSEYLANLPTGALAQVSNLWGDIKEQVGEVVATPLTLFLQEARDFVSEILDGLTEWIKDANVISDLTSISASLFVSIRTTGKAIWQIVRLISGVLSDIIGAIIQVDGEIVAHIAKPIAKVINQVAALVSKLPLVPDGIKNGMADAAKSAAGFLNNIGQNIINVGKVAQDSGNDLILSSVGNLSNLSKETNKEINRIQARIDAINASRKNGNKQAGATQNSLSGSSSAASSGEKLKESSEKKEAEQAIITYQQYLQQRESLMAASAERINSYQASLFTQQDIADKDKIAMMNAYRLEQQQALNQQLAQIGDTYRAQEANADLAAYSLVMDQKWQMEQEARQKREEAEAAWRAAEQEYLGSTLKNTLSSLGDSFVNMFEQGVEGTLDMRQASYDMFKSLAKNIFSNSISQIVQSMVGWATQAGQSQAGIPIVGPILAAAASASVLAMMGIMKAKAGKEAKIQYATGGYVSAGMVRGAYSSADSVSALLQPGERVLSKAETKAYDEGRINPGTTVNINVSIMGGFDRRTIQTEVREYLIPEIKRALGQGYNLNPA